MRPLPLISHARDAAEGSSCLPCSADRCCDGGLGAAGVQFLSVAYWYLLRKPAGVDVAAVPLLGWLAGLALVGFGQVSPCPWRGSLAASRGA